MPLISRFDRHDVGIASIDAQHREMAEILNKLEASLAPGASPDSTGKILAALIAFTEAHFEHEQELFRQANYPAAEVHGRRHAFLRLILKRGCEAFGGNRATDDAGGQLQFLRGWLMDHIRIDDQAFADYVRDKQATPPALEPVAENGVPNRG